MFNAQFTNLILGEIYQAKRTADGVKECGRTSGRPPLAETEWCFHVSVGTTNIILSSFI